MKFLVFLIYSVILFLLFHFDARTLRRRNNVIYQKTVVSPPWLWALICLPILTIPLYLFRRRRFELAVLNEPVPEFLSGDLNEQPDVDHEGLRRISDASGLVILWLIINVIGAALVRVLSPHSFFKIELNQLVAASVFELFLMIFLIYLVTRRPRGSGFLAGIGLVANRQPFWKLFVMPAFIGLLMACLASSEVFVHQKPPVTPLSRTVAAANSVPAVLFFLGFVTLLVPFFEEIIFRGYFFGAVSRYKGKAVALFFVAGIFALLHVEQYWGDWKGIFAVSLLAFVLTWLRAASGSTITSIVTHYVYNATVTVIPLFMIILANPSYYQYRAQYQNLTTAAKESLLVKSIAEDPQQPDSYNELAWLYAEENRDLDHALRLVDKALALSANRDAYLDTKAEVLYKLKRYHEAVRIEEGLVSRNPGVEFYAKQLEKFRSGLAPKPLPQGGSVPGEGPLEGEAKSPPATDQ